MASLGIEPYAVKTVPRAHSERVRAFDASRIYDAVLRAFLMCTKMMTTSRPVFVMLKQ